jgi:glycosyltransferase involved in cell wall biosynthesis
MLPVAGALERHFDTETIGPLFGDASPFAPLRHELRATSLRAPAPEAMSLGGYRRLWRETAARATGAVLYAFKPLLASFAAALYCRRRLRVPVVLDIEDWDAAGYRALSLRGRWGRWRLRQLFRDQLDPINTRLMETRIGRADALVVSSTFLQRRYGGTIVVQGVDAGAWTPEAFDAATERARFGLPASAFLVLFTGTAQPHKGLPDLVGALASGIGTGAHLVVAGPATEELRRLQETSGDVLIYVGELPHREMPGLLAACDAVCLPQRDTPFARAQIPAKVFEAMAMAKPIVATAISDLPDILRGAGILVPPGDPAALAEALRALAASPEVRASLGGEARRRCLLRYTWDVMAETLRTVVEPLLGPRDVLRAESPAGAGPRRSAQPGAPRASGGLPAGRSVASREGRRAR